MINVTDLPEEQLKKSKIYQKYAAITGKCSICQEDRAALSPCCGGPIHFNGVSVYPEELWCQIEDELLEMPDDHIDDEINGN